MPIISVQIITGRTPEQKRALMKELATAAIKTLGVPEQSVRVILREVPPENWGIGLTTKADKDGGAG